MKGHDTMCVMLSSRHKNLQAVRSAWVREDIKVRRRRATSARSLCVSLLKVFCLCRVLWTQLCP